MKPLTFLKPSWCHLDHYDFLPKHLSHNDELPGQGKLTATFRAACQHGERSIPGLRRPMSLHLNLSKRRKTGTGKQFKLAFLI